MTFPCVGLCTAIVWRTGLLDGSEIGNEATLVSSTHLDDVTNSLIYLECEILIT